MTLFLKRLEIVNSLLHLFLMEQHMEFGMITKNGKVFVSTDYDKSTEFIFSMTTNDHKPNVMLFNVIKKYNFFRNFMNNYKCRCCLF